MNKNYKVKQLRKGQYLYTTNNVQFYLEYDAEQTNGMVSGGFGVWKAYPVYKSEILWSAPSNSDWELWYDRKKYFVREFKENPEVFINCYGNCISDHKDFIARSEVSGGYQPNPDHNIQVYNDPTGFDRTPVGRFVNELINA